MASGSVQISREGLKQIAQVEGHNESQQSEDGMNVFWTADPNREMPIEVSKGPESICKLGNNNRWLSTHYYA